MPTVTAQGREVSRRLHRPATPKFIRLEMDPATVPAVEDAAHAARLSLASYCRLAVELLAQRGKVTADELKAEADRRLAKEPPSEPKKGKGKK